MVWRAIPVTPLSRAGAACAVLLVLSVARLPAQTPQAPDIRRAIGALSARLDSLEAGNCPAGPAVAVPAGADSMRQALRALGDRLERTITARCGTIAAVPGGRGNAAAEDDLAALRAAADAAAQAGGAPPATPADTTNPPPPVQFIGKQRNASALNPEISATGDVRLVARDGRQVDNGVAREFEVGIQSALDPYSNTKIFLSFEDAGVSVEEGYIYWTGLPGRIRLDVGKFRQQVGDLNRWHLHALPETEYPLVYQRFLSPEGLAGIGLSLYTPLPVSIAGGTHELWVQGTTAESDALLAGSRQPVGLARLQNFWQLSRSTYAQVGFTGIVGQNSDSALKSNVLGVDFRLTWRPPGEGTRKNVTLRAEGYRLHANQPGDVTDRYGAFAQAVAQVSRRWILGARYDYVEAPRGPYADEWAVTPTITWVESEFVFLRLQGEHSRELGGQTLNQATVQVVWAMGPHKHETY